MPMTVESLTKESGMRDIRDAISKSMEACIMKVART